MKLLTFFTADGIRRAGRLDGDTVTEVGSFTNLDTLLAAGDLASAATATGAQHRLDDIRLAPVVTQPSKIVCLGQNYAAHIREQNGEMPSHPTLFAKYTSALIGPRDDIVLPRVSECADWEVELAFVMGRRARHVTAEEGEAAIAGYTIMNDVSVRDFQKRTAQWLQGKTFDRSTPVGPWMVTPDEFDPHAARLTCEVDGEVMQDSTTADVVFRPGEVVAYISQIVALEPGDLITTGTPAGVGAFRNPPVFLRAGQTVKCAIAGIGELVNRCVAEA